MITINYHYSNKIIHTEINIFVTSPRVYSDGAYYILGYISKGTSSICH